MISETAITLTTMSDPDTAIPGRLLTLEGRYAELSLEGAGGLGQGCLVQFKSPEALYLGEVEAVSAEGRVRVLIEHSVNLERAGAVRRLWNSANIL